MKKWNVNSILLVWVILFAPALSLQAKCFQFRNGGDIRVCIDGNDNKTRKAASDVCESIKGSDCGPISGYSGSCNKGSSTRCFDGSGKEHKKLTAD